jgi:methylated-DNA-[protein]-cysteine S-methyltransferase
METLFYSRMSSPAGPLLIGASNTALVILEFDRGLPESIAGEPAHWEQSGSRTAETRSQLEEYFAGKRKQFTMPLDLRGTEFRKRCWEELLRIPYGETRTYAQIAQAVGSPAGFRAVGQANHYNPVAIIVPCHRVLAAGKRLGGYGGGLPIKAFLLKLEGAEFRDEATDSNQSHLALTASG